jgi:hypothetical protein
MNMPSPTRREILLAATTLTAASAAGTSKVLKNMGSAGPGLGARIRATQQAGKKWDIVEYCHDMGLGAAHTSLPKGPRARRNQINSGAGE